MTSAVRASFPNPRGKQCGLRCFYFAAVLLAGRAYSEEPLEKLIDQLADENAVTREAAERAIVARGPGILEALERRKLHCSWQDVEANARLVNAIGRIRDDVAWIEAERSARSRTTGRMCIHCRESAGVDAVRLRDPFLARFLPGARLVALRGACCAEAAKTWQVLLSAEDGAVAEADFEKTGALFSRLEPVENTADACRLAAALEAALTEPGRFEEAWTEWLAETEVVHQDGKQTRVQCGTIARGRAFTFDAAGRLTGVNALSW
ncbi:MAG: hypothetical protein FD180_3685 [Planctomycetota bacterium]|nr:MAG: hypothetical protein FD180_3685 [Planctomycetota bacterium]